MWKNELLGITAENHSEIRAAMPNVMLPAILTDECIESHGWTVYEPVLTPEQIEASADADKANLLAAIKSQLADIDTKKIRPVGDILLGNGDIPDNYGKTPKQRLAELEAQASVLRSQL